MAAVHVCCGQLGLPIRRSVRIKHPDVKKCSLETAPPETIARMSSRAPSSTLADAPVSVSPLIGCKCGSIETLWQTSDRRLAVRSHISL